MRGLYDYRYLNDERKKKCFFFEVGKKRIEKNEENSFGCEIDCNITHTSSKTDKINNGGNERSNDL